MFECLNRIPRTKQDQCYSVYSVVIFRQKYYSVYSVVILRLKYYSVVLCVLRGDSGKNITLWYSVVILRQKYYSVVLCVLRGDSGKNTTLWNSVYSVVILPLFPQFFFFPLYSSPIHFFLLFLLCYYNLER